MGHEELLKKFVTTVLDEGWFEAGIAAYDSETNDEAVVYIAFDFDAYEQGDAMLVFRVGEQWTFSVDVDSTLKMLVDMADWRRKVDAEK
jgi:hypothetical protein